MNGVIREINARGMEKGVALRMSVEDRVWELNRLLFVDNPALMDDSEEKLVIW